LPRRLNPFEEKKIADFFGRFFLPKRQRRAKAGVRRRRRRRRSE
jgi:hypothetical protein